MKKMYTKYYKDMLNYTTYRIKNKDIVEDIVQDTFLAALKNEDDFEKLSSQKTWLYGILKHKIIDYFVGRTYKIKDEIEYIENLIELNVDEIKKDHLEILYIAITKLKGIYYDVIVFYIQGYSFLEISELLNISVINARGILHRSKEKLRTIIKKL